MTRRKTPSHILLVLSVLVTVISLSACSGGGAGTANTGKASGGAGTKDAGKASGGAGSRPAAMDFPPIDGAYGSELRGKQVNAANKALTDLATQIGCKVGDPTGTDSWTDWGLHCGIAASSAYIYIVQHASFDDFASAVLRTDGLGWPSMTKDDIIHEGTFVAVGDDPEARDAIRTGIAAATVRIVTTEPPDGSPNTTARLSTDGYGPVRFGMTLAEAQTALGGPITTQETGGSACLQGSYAAAPKVTFAIVDGKVVAAGVAGGGQQEAIMTATTSGIHVGSSLADLKATLKGLTSRAYASSTGVTEYDYTAASGRASSFQVDDRTQQVTGFLFGDAKWVIGVEYICL